ncbi:MAG TPA: TonB-dependent receptor [Steroidobacteraceae bacterium]|nr:TonB-dependent receptor [Steroidobacteraceae bacterium]
MNDRNFHGGVAPVCVRLAIRVALALAAGAGAGNAVAADNTDSTLDEVVVTAQFREQNLQTTPLSITAVSGELLELRSQTNIAEVASQAPNVTLKPQGAAYGPSLGASIRGVGQFDFNPALEPGVGIYVDDVYYATLTGSVLDLLDLDRIEILRGPQGTLAGRNSIGGAVKLYSKKPTGSDTGSLQATYGSRHRVELRGSADFKLGENLFAHISGVSKQQDGAVKRMDYGCLNPASGVPILQSAGAGCKLGTLGDVNYDAVKLSLRWLPSENVEIGASIDYTNDDRTPAGAVMVQASTAVNGNIQPVQGVGGTALPLAAFVVPRGSYYNYATFYNPKGTYTRPSTGATTPMLETRPDIRAKFRGWGGSFNIDWKLAEKLSLKSITAYRTYDSYFANDNDLSPLANSLGYGTTAFNSFSEEVRLNGAALADDRLEYTLGAYYSDQKTVYATTQDLRYAATGLTQFMGNDPVRADSKAAFGHLSYKLTDPLTLNLGLRYTDEHKDYTFRRRTYAGALHPTLGVLDGVTSNYDGSEVDYRANLQYQVTDAVMGYVQFATGFKGGGISPRPFSPAQAVPFSPEKLKSYEAGFKSDLFDRTLRVNGSVFFSKYTDMQLTLSNCPQFPPASPCAVVANAGNAEMRGVELESTFRPTRAWSMDASFSYLKFKYTYINPGAGGPTRPAGPQFGMDPAYVPHTKFSLGTQYEFSLAGGSSLTARADMSWQGEMFTNGVNAATNRVAPYGVGNARLIWRNGEGDWETSLEATNITDKYYFVTRFDQYTTTGVTDGQPGRPREFALTVKKKF